MAQVQEVIVQITAPAQARVLIIGHHVLQTERYR